ncbi:MAG: hypothetical protein R3Y34_03185 [Rikenellaceae bacterium]
MFGVIIKNLMHIAYAIDNGWIPVVDMQNFRTFYRDSENTATNNVWEYYFNQPMGYDLNDIKDSKNIVLSKRPANHWPNEKHSMMLHLGFCNDVNRIEYYNQLYHKYITYNSHTQEYISNEYDKIMSGKGRVVGVLCRGTDYVMAAPKGHSIQPNPLDIIEKTKQVMEEYNCDYVYLSTEDEENYQLFKSAFKDKLLVNKQDRIQKKDISQGEWIFQIKEKSNANARSGLEYLSSLNILSKCTCFIAGQTGGTVGVLFMTDGFEYKYVYDLGCFN